MCFRVGVCCYLLFEFKFYGYLLRSLWANQSKYFKSNLKALQCNVR